MYIDGDFLDCIILVHLNEVLLYKFDVNISFNDVHNYVLFWRFRILNVVKNFNIHFFIYFYNIY